MLLPALLFLTSLPLAAIYVVFHIPIFHREYAKSIFLKAQPCDGALVAQVTCISPRASLRLYCGYTPSDIIACSCPYGRGVWVSMGVRLSILSVDKRTGKNDQKIVDGDGTTRLLSSSTHSPSTLNRGEANYTDERTHFFREKLL